MPDTNENTNCLQGMKCPECGSLEPFDIVATTVVSMWDEGSEDAKGFEWGDTNYCTCTSCEHHALVSEFQQAVQEDAQ